MNTETYIYIGIAFVLIVIFIAAGIFFRKRRQGEVKAKTCNHNFKEKGYFVCREMPRLLLVCKKCEVAIHVPILTQRQLRELEDKKLELPSIKQEAGRWQ